MAMEVSSLVKQLLFTTVRVETYDAAGNQGIGTSFIFGYQLRGEQYQYSFLVTNKHVVKGAQKGRLTFTKAHNGKPLLGNGYALDIIDSDSFEQLWYGHPSEEVDITVTELKPLVEHIKENGVNIFYRTIGSNLIPSEETLNKIDALEEVVFIGYPSGIWDRKNLLPIIRKGITATPITIDFQGEKQFLIDASVFPGSSGSPVFLYNAGMYFEKTGATVVGTRLMFLGVLTSVYYQQDKSEIRIRSLSTPDNIVILSKQMIDLGIVFKPITIIEVIKKYLEGRGIFTD